METVGQSQVCWPSWSWNLAASVGEPGSHCWGAVGCVLQLPWGCCQRLQLLAKKPSALWWLLGLLHVHTFCK